MLVDLHKVTSHGSLKLPWLTLLIGTFAVGLYLWAGPAAPAWVFDRIAIGQGEWWRLFTGHFVHSDLSHLQWDIVAFVVIAGMLEQQSRRLILSGLSAGFLVIGGWLWWGEPELLYYCGLSGINHTLLVLLFHQLWKGGAHPLLFVSGLAVVAKMIVELVSNQALFTNTAWPSLPSAHVAGVAAAVLFLIIQQRQSRAC
ncbi:MAG: rhombosortase [Chromatiales bacterium]|nr:rhombosortase [Chromatiales bacterium]